MSRESKAVPFVNKCINVHIVVYDMKVGFLTSWAQFSPRIGDTGQLLAI
jgi:hypothetical protein